MKMPGPVLVALMTVSAPLAAKAPTVRITITGPDQSAPIEIIEPGAGAFSVWAGPGVYVNGAPQTSGFIADWQKGPKPEPSATLRRYRIAFYTGCKPSETDLCRVAEPQLSYVVLYAYDAATGQAYVYLPGRGEPWYEVNTRSILRSVEGNWFLASSEWQGFVRPFLAGR